MLLHAFIIRRGASAAGSILVPLAYLPFWYLLFSRPEACWVSTSRILLTADCWVLTISTRAVGCLRVLDSEVCVTLASKQFGMIPQILPSYPLADTFAGEAGSLTKNP